MIFDFNTGRYLSNEVSKAPTSYLQIRWLQLVTQRGLKVGEKLTRFGMDFFINMHSNLTTDFIPFGRYTLYTNSYCYY